MDGRKRRRHAAARSRVAAGALSVSVFLGLGANMAVTSAGSADDTASSTSEQQQSSWSATAASPSSDQQAVTSSRASGDSLIRTFSPFDEPLADIFAPAPWERLGLSWEFPERRGGWGTPSKLPGAAQVRSRLDLQAWTIPNDT